MFSPFLTTNKKWRSSTPEKDLSFRSSMRMTGLLLENLWTGSGRAVLLILTSSFAFVDANGGAILPSLNKVYTHIGFSLLAPTGAPIKAIYYILY